MSLKRVKQDILPISILLLFSFILSLTTRFGFFATGMYGSDSGIFAYVGYAVKNGLVLYSEVWDNKGPLLYFINMVGISINHYHGIFFIELIGFITSGIFAYKTSLLITKGECAISTLAAVFSMLLLVETLEGGNLSEEYSIPFTCIALYFTTKFFMNNNYTLKAYEYIVIGISFCAVLLLRANMCAFFIPMVLIVVFALVKRREWNTLLKAFCFTLIGVVVFATPFLVYLISNNALMDCINAAYLNVLSNFTSLPTKTVIANMYGMIRRTERTGTLYIALVFIISFCVCMYKKQIEDKELRYLLVISFAGMLCNLFANTLSGAGFMHYFMTFVPIMVIPSAWVFHALHKYASIALEKEDLGRLATVLVVLFISLSGILRLGDNIKFESGDYDYVAEYIIHNSEPDQTIQIIGRGAWSLCYKTQRLAASKYYFGHGMFTDEMVSVFAESIAEDVIEKKPQLIMFVNEVHYDRFVEWLVSKERFFEFVSENYELTNEDFHGYSTYELIRH